MARFSVSSVELLGSSTTVLTSIEGIFCPSLSAFDYNTIYRSTLYSLDTDSVFK
jgi:hypothetical protein